AFALLYGRQQVAPRRLLGVELSGGLLNALWLAASWFGLQWLTQLAFNSGGPHVAIWSHIGGFIAGLALAPALSSRRG
ncbi:MAG: rhomboid family intramembrane serine protease, partial [Sphingomonadales bacterium]